MVKIRLARGGVKNKPFYRIVAIEKRRKIKGRPLDILGYWNPINKDLKIDKKKLKEWTEKGAQLSHGLRKLLTENPGK